MVDVSRGQRIGRLSSEWFSQPDYQRFLSVNDLASSVRSRSERSRTGAIEIALIHVEASRNGPERRALALPGAERFKKAAPFRRNDQMLNVLLKAMVACPGNSINANLVDQGRKLWISVGEPSNRSRRDCGHTLASEWALLAAFL